VTFAIPLAAAVLGLMIGSFLNVCIGRIPEGESVVTPGSRCPKCKTPIAWYDNIPVLSYLLLRGRCRSCHAAISVRYPLVELTTAAAFLLQAVVIGEDLSLLASRLAFTAALIVLFGTDWDVQRLPDVITLPGIVAGLAGSIWLPPGLAASALGALLGAAILLAIRWLWQRLRGVDAMGLGDVKMLAMIGAFLGWQQVWVVLILASFAGAVLGISLNLVKGKSMQTRLPFGTFLAIAAYIASLWGERWLAWYLSLAGL
jgi:leader peptidase (prepilin peptidase)/N-methyltransferase